MKNKKIIVPIAVILLLIGGGGLWVKNEENQKLGAKNEKQEENESTFANSGVVKEFKKLSVLPHKCIGCGRCARIDSEHFEIVENKSAVITTDNLNSEKLQSAIKNCPAKAIVLE